MSGVLIPNMMAGVLLLFCADHVCDSFFRRRKAIMKVFRKEMKKIALQEEYTQELLDKQNALDKKR